MRLCLLLATCLTLFGRPSCVFAQNAAWRTGRDFREQLALEVGITWNSELRPALQNLAANQRVAVMLDRRVDPGQPVQLSAELPLERLLERIAADLNLDVTYIGPVVYFGPPQTVQRLATVAALKREQARTRPALVRLRPWAWEELATPRDLIQQLAAEAGLQVAGLEHVPHDLWPAVDLPPLPFADRMTLVLAGFDLSFELSGAGLSIVRMPESPNIEKVFRVARDAAGLADQFAKRFPNAAVQQTGAAIRVVGRYEDVDAIERLLSGDSVPRPNSTAGEGEKRYTLKVENKPVGDVVRALAAKLKLQVEFSPQATPKLGELISFQVQEVARDELLKAVLSPAGLEFEIRGSLIEVTVSP